MDENGLIVVGFDVDKNGNIIDSFINSWFLKEPNSVDVGGELPYVIFNQWSSDHYIKIESNLTSSIYFYNFATNSYEKDDNSSLNGTLTINLSGALIFSDTHQWTDENNVTHTTSFTKSFQIINTIGRYDVIKKNINSLKVM